jgi:tellurite resistance protein TerC
VSDQGALPGGKGATTPRRAVAWSVAWFLLAMLFAGALGLWRSREESLQFLTGYLIEYSLSLDNVFAMAVVFAWFGVSVEHQHRLLRWGILGVILMRGLLIVTGSTLLQTFHWLFYILGLFVFGTGARWAFSKPAALAPQNNPVVRLARKAFPVSATLDGDRFLTLADGRRALTPLALALLAVETTDLLFALDSIPAVLAVTQNPFIVFTSNLFAVLGLRSLYFVLTGAMENFRYLRAGVAVVLMVIGLKMLAARWITVPVGVSLALVLGIVTIAIACSFLPRRTGKSSIQSLP